MRATILALLLPTLFTGCGSDGDSAANACAVFPMVATEPLKADVQEQLVEFGGSCVDYDEGKTKYMGVSENMTVYLNGKVLDRARWEVYDVRRIRLFGAYAFGDAKFSLSYGCTAKVLVPGPYECGYINEDKPYVPRNSQ